jgi:glycerate dehydrogenase
MNIVVLDGRTANPGDLSWEPLKTFGDCIIYDRTQPDDIVSRAKEADIALTNKTILSRNIIEQLPKLKYIGVLATGYNVVNLEAAAERNILVTNVPAYCTEAVAQLCFAHILNLTKRPADHAAGVRNGKWSASIDFCYWDYSTADLAGLTIGIVGFGRIGRAVAQIANAFEMNILVNTRTQPKNAPEYIRLTNLETLFRTADFVSLHCPLTGDNHQFVSTKLLSFMRKTAFLINTARGPLIDEQALADALNSESIAGAGLDVLSTEPPSPDNPLLTAENCFITPHIGWTAKAARQRLLDITVENIRAFITGQPKNVVNQLP